MTRAVLYSRSRRPGRAEAGAIVSAAAAKPTFHTKLRQWAQRRERGLLVGGGVAAALVALGIVTLFTPHPRTLTQKDIDAAVGQSLKNRPAEPFHAAVANAAIQPSVVLVRRLGEIGEGAGKSGQSAGRKAKDRPPLLNPPGADADAGRSGSTAEGRHGGGRAHAGAAQSKSLADKDGGEKDHATGLGTGVVISDEGLVLTCLHVIAGAKRVGLTFADGTESDAEVVSVQPQNDLAVLKAKTLPDDLIPATLRSTKDLKVGDEVIAVGFPFALGASTTYGVVSGLRREHDMPDGQTHMVDLIQFDAAANPGNSGGPLVTAEGDVVGIVTAIFNPTDTGFFVGIAFAVPIENAAAAAGMSPF